MLPVAAPLAVGLNCACNVALWPGCSVTGRPPITLNPAPETVAELTVSAEVPIEVNVKGIVFAVFTVTLPKARLPGLMESCGPAVPGPEPLPRSAICVMGLEDGPMTVASPE
jgi:hypothetical protein